MAEALTFPAAFRTDGTVLMLAGVPLALRATGTASGATCLQHYFENHLVAAGPAGAHCAGCPTDIRTVQIQPDTLSQLLHHVSPRQASVQAMRDCSQSKPASMQRIRTSFVLPFT